MGQYQDIFERYEKKYLLDAETYQGLADRLEEYLEVDQYGKTTICDIYYDTPDHRMIRASLEKPVYKEKLRLRSYGVPKADDTVFVELKKKYKGVVYKRRVDMALTEATGFLDRGFCPGRESQIEKEIDRVLDFYPGVRPAMFLSYDRIATFGKGEPSLRVTFDSRILWRETKLDLREGAWGTALLPTGYRLMEIKMPGSMPVWLSRLLDEMRVYPVSFSKYGSAYQASLAKNTTGKGAVHCA